MWLLATYQPTTLFSLKPSNATSSGGKTLLTPTPYTIKMALLDAAIRTKGLAAARLDWEWLRSLSLAARLPERAVVNNTFTRILKLTRTDAADDDEVPSDKGVFDRTIGYREYVYFAGVLKLAFEVKSDSHGNELELLLPHITYFGKRGGFFQFQPTVETVEVLPVNFTQLVQQQGVWHIESQLQHIDDCDAEMPFECADIYSKERITIGKERLVLLTIVPYRLKRSSRSFSDYERVDIAPINGQF